MMRKTYLSIIYIFSFLLVVSCQPSENEVSNREAIEVNSTTHQVFEENVTESTFTIEPSRTVSVTATPRISYQETNTNEIDVDKVKIIDEKVFYFLEIYGERGENLALQFSYLDFSQIDSDNAKDIGLYSFQFLDPSGNNFQVIRNIQIFNEGNDLIYLAPNKSNSKVNLYHYDSDTGISNIISTSDILKAHVTSDGNHIAYVTRNQELYIVDINGYGFEFTSFLNTQGIASFSPDCRYLISAATSKQNSGDENSGQLGMYLISLFEPNNPLLLDIAKNKFGQLPDWYGLVWSNNSKEIYYFRGEDNEKWNVCKMSLDTKTEKCYSDFDFSDIDTLDISDEGKIIISASIETVDKNSCNGMCDERNINHDLYILNPGENELIKISDTENTEIHPIFIDNGNYIIYQRMVGMNWQIFITNQAGSFTKQLTFCKGDCVLEGY